MALKFYNSGQEGIADDIRRALLAAGEQMGGRDFGITFGYRSPEHNKRVGGAKSSYHTRGEAVDIDMKGMSEAQRAARAASRPTRRWWFHHLFQFPGHAAYRHAQDRNGKAAFHA